jgi:hypothetical protein
VDRAVVHEVLDGCANQAVLVDSLKALELGRAHDGSEMVAAALVDHLDVGAGQRVGDQALDLPEISHTCILRIAASGEKLLQGCSFSPQTSIGRDRLR